MKKHLNNNEHASSLLYSPTVPSPTPEIKDLQSDIQETVSQNMSYKNPETINSIHALNYTDSSEVPHALKIRLGQLYKELLAYKPWQEYISFDDPDTGEKRSISANEVYGLPKRITAENHIPLDALEQQNPEALLAYPNYEILWPVEHAWQYIEKRMKHPNILTVLHNEKSECCGFMQGYYAPFDVLWENEWQSQGYSEELKEEFMQGLTQHLGRKVDGNTKFFAMGMLGIDYPNRNVKNFDTMNAKFYEGFLAEWDKEAVIGEAKQGTTNHIRCITTGCVDICNTGNDLCMLMVNASIAQYKSIMKLPQENYTKLYGKAYMKVKNDFIEKNALKKTQQ